MPKHKCEHCGLEIQWRGKKQRERVKGWIGTGDKSRYGKEFDRRGCAWWCPEVLCLQVKESYGIKKLFPDMSLVEQEELLREIILKKLMEN